MPTKLLTITLLLSLSLITYSIMTTQSFIFQRNTGTWTQTITSDPTTNPDPSRYGICGLAFRQMKYTKRSYICNCRFNCYGNWVCNWCDTDKWQMTNAIKISYCAFDDPSKKIVKVFETGNTLSGKWREVNCPAGQVVTKLAVRLAMDEGIDLGWNGVQMTCSAMGSNATTVVKDGYTFPLTAPTANSQGTYATGVMVKYEKGGKLTGIRVFFERRAMISNIDMNYGEITPLGEPTEQVVERVEILNSDFRATNILVALTKNYSITNEWTNSIPTYDNYTYNYSSTNFTPASLNNSSQETEYYTIVSTPSVFNQQVTRTYLPTKTTSNNLPGCSKVIVTSSIIVQRAMAPYTATITFADAGTEEVITTVVVEGTWVGVERTGIKTVVEYPQIDGCGGD